MVRVLYLAFIAFTMIAIGNTFARYSSLTEIASVNRSPDMSERLEEKMNFFREKFEFLRHKSILLDKSVETNEKLYYLTHSDNFEEALFLIDYLADRFAEFDPGDIANREVAISDFGFYLQRLEENLAVVERDLKDIAREGVEVVQR